jgi:hypothetical protein
MVAWTNHDQAISPRFERKVPHAKPGLGRRVGANPKPARRFLGRNSFGC